jgi:hypothetical protein
VSTDSGPSLIAGRYEVVRTLGQGAFGRTLLVRDREQDREVAIKVLDTRRVDSFKGFELFDREAAVLRSVRHHGVPEIHDAFRGDWEGQPAAFLVMEYVAGRSLAQIIDDQHPIDPESVLHILVELLGVLDYLHNRVPPILHRDIKPANVILRPDGFPTLVDFGAVRNAILPAGQDGSTIVGTYGYMPYEQHMGQATPASDLYALAATMLHLLTGRAPPEFMLPEGRLEVPEALPGGPVIRQVLARLLRPAPTERFQSARETRQALLATTARPGEEAAGTGLGPRLYRVPARLELPAAPRALEGATLQEFRRLAPTTWRYINADEAPGGPVDPAGVALVVFFSVVTAGVLPLLFWARARARRKKLRRFFQAGVPAVAEVTAMQDLKVEFELKLTRVRYEWDADGTVHRDSDETFTWISDKWRVGDRIRILYLPHAGYDSVIVEG